jgi:putative DNA primase/helicase
VWVLGDGAFVILGPRSGYHWAGGSKAAADAGITDATDALRMRLMHEGLITVGGRVNRDAPWRTRPGTPLVAGDPRTYTRRGDVRRLVDSYGDKMLFTPGLGWRVWTESGWGGPERSETMLRSYVMDLPDVHMNEWADLKKRGEETLAKDAYKWGGKSHHRATTQIFGELQTDERILVPSANDWDAEGYIAGLPVTGGIGRLVDLRTGQIVLDQRTRRVSKTLGAQYEEGAGGDLKRLWDIGVEGGPGKWFVKYITDLTDQMGVPQVKLLQRAAGATLYGRRDVDGDTDAVFVLKGPPRSGKSSFSECLLAVAGSYGKAMNHNLLFGDKGNPEFSDAAIFGYRMLELSEPPMNAPLNTTKLKQLSGGDSITGRLPYGREEVSFQPECSLWLLTNHALEVSDEAVWRRMKFFRFEHAREDSDDLPTLRRMVTQDPNELRLACAWMIHGAMAWAADGWGDTTVWEEATEDEQAKHDVKVKWAKESLVVSGSVVDTFTHADMMANFSSWLMFSGEDAPALSKVALRDELENLAKRLGVRWDAHGKVFVGGRLV